MDPSSSGPCSITGPHATHNFSRPSVLGQHSHPRWHDDLDRSIYRPFWHICEILTGCILGAFLRPGNAHSAESVLIALRPIIARLKEAFPLAPTYLRADSGFAGPALYEFCESNGIDFTIADEANCTYKRRSDELLALAKARYEGTGRKVTLYDHWPHQART